MSKQLDGLVNDEHRQQCIVCDEGVAVWSMRREEFAYGTGATAVMLNAEVPVWSCPECDLQYLADGAETVQHDAVCRFLGRLTPAAIRDIRAQADMTQVAFAQALNVGVASIKRWESGVVIPNASMNSLLMEFALKPREVARPVPQFRTQFAIDKLAAAARWLLRPPSAHPSPAVA